VGYLPLLKLVLGEEALGSGGPTGSVRPCPPAALLGEQDGQRPPQASQGHPESGQTPPTVNLGQQARRGSHRLPPGRLRSQIAQRNAPAGQETKLNLLASYDVPTEH